MFFVLLCPCVEETLWWPKYMCLCVCLLFKLLQKVFLGFILVVHVPAGFFSLLPFLLLFYHCQVFPFSSPFVCSSFKGQFKPPRLHLENFASVFKVWKIYIIESKVSCSASRDVHTWNIIVPQRLVSLCTHLVDRDHLHTGGIFDCPVAWSPSTPPI